MNVLIACEESQTVCKAFRKRGHRAFSCDVLECSGGHPEWHIQTDVLRVLNGNCTFNTADTHTHTQRGTWDLIVAHPPCTYLTVSGNRWFNTERYGDRAIQRMKDREDAAEFFMKFVNADCYRVAIENPIGYMNTHYRKPDQVIQPYMFGDPVRKATCLWLKNLPLLVPTNVVEPNVIHRDGYSMSGPAFGVRDENGKFLPWNDPEVARVRSKTYEGIADAIAEQWGSQKYCMQMSLF